MWRPSDIPGVLQHRTQVSAQIKRDDENKWQSFSPRKAAEQAARQVAVENALQEKLLQPVSE
jgi:hypothetical protein